MTAPTPTSRPDGPAAEEVLALEHEFLKALNEYDVATLDRLCAEGYTLVAVNGATLSKQEHLAVMRETAHWGRNYLEYGDVEVRLFGEAALTRGRVALLDRRGRVKMRWIYTRAWARPDGRWQVISTALTQVAKKFFRLGTNRLALDLRVWRP